MNQEGSWFSLHLPDGVEKSSIFQFLNQTRPRRRTGITSTAINTVTDVPRLVGW
jgi:hypothetical protein